MNGQLMQTLQQLLSGVFILPILLLLLAFQIFLIYWIIRGSIWLGNKLWRGERKIEKHFKQFVDPDILKWKQDKK